MDIFGFNKCQFVHRKRCVVVMNMTSELNATTEKEMDNLAKYGHKLKESVHALKS